MKLHCVKRAAAALGALALAAALPAAALAEEPSTIPSIVVNDDIVVSGDYNWTRLADENITLNVYNWGQYISDGSDDSVNILSAFEELTGIRVN